jgi:hypothetical protein
MAKRTGRKRHATASPSGYTATPTAGPRRTRSAQTAARDLVERPGDHAVGALGALQGRLDGRAQLGPFSHAAPFFVAARRRPSSEAVTVRATHLYGERRLVGGASRCQRADRPQSICLRGSRFVWLLQADPGRIGVDRAAAGAAIGAGALLPVLDWPVAGQPLQGRTRGGQQLLCRLLCHPVQQAGHRLDPAFPRLTNPSFRAHTLGGPRPVVFFAFCCFTNCGPRYGIL